MIPDWIKESDFYLAYINDYPDEVFHVDKNLLIEFPTQLTNENIYEVLETIRYFGISDIKYLYKHNCPMQFI